MPIRDFRPTALLVLLALTGCSDSGDPWVSLPNPPLTQGRLHTVTLAGDSARAQEQARGAGYSPLLLPPNYPAALRVETSLWDVREPVVGKALLFKSPSNGPDLRILEMPLAARGMEASATSQEHFYRNVLGSDVPAWPAGIERGPALRVQAWTFFVPSVVEASKRLRENGIAVIFDAVSLTTPYLGDHRTLAIRAPDGTIVQLVESRTQ
ncbi:MAG: hypothetical protein H7Y89_10820 [Steroidobacteraceae bacterium]|nr:hypothetical protein [Steroidobacteraceae bacterium]